MKHRRRSTFRFLRLGWFGAPSAWALLAATSLPAVAEPVFDEGAPGDMTPRATTLGAPAFTFAPGTGWAVGGANGWARSSVTSPPMRILGDGGATVTVTHAFDFEWSAEDNDAFDGGHLNVRVNGGPPILVDAWTTGGYGDELDGIDGLGFTPGWFGTNAGPLTSVAELTGVSAGDVIELIFEAGWDLSTARPAPNWTIASLDVAGVEILPVVPE